MEHWRQRLPHLQERHIFAALAVLACVSAIAFERGERPDFDGPERVSPISVALLGIAAMAIVIETAGFRWRRVDFATSILIPGAWFVLVGRNSIAPVFLILLVAWFAYTRPRREAITCWAATLAMLTVTIPFAPGITLDWTGWIMGITFAAGGGLILSAQRRLLDDLRATQERLALQSALAERQRIARDLHDVIAHTMSITLLQVTGARHILKRDPERAAHALDEAAILGRQSLADIRRIVGILGEKGSDDLRIAPSGIRDIAPLVYRYADAGLWVHMEASGDEWQVPEAIGREIYRIAQEALNNVVRHAPGAIAVVRLTIDPGLVCLDVEDDGARPGSVSPTVMAQPGRGLAGIRERVAIFGGRVSIGRYGDGWRVSCGIPLDNPVGKEANA